jgi:hypothetical protein
MKDNMFGLPRPDHLDSAFGGRWKFAIRSSGYAGAYMLERLWLWADKSPWRVAGILFVIGAGNAAGFFWHYPWAPVRAFFDSVFAIGFLGAAGWKALETIRD